MKKPLKGDENHGRWRKAGRDGSEGWNFQWFFVLFSLENVLKNARFGIFIYHNPGKVEMMESNGIKGFRVIVSLKGFEMDKNILKYCKISSLLIAEFRILYLRIQN